ncbi:MAG: hypothetical protein Q9209_000790 [Squamulea sp. 1 TL-2023]
MLTPVSAMAPQTTSTSRTVQHAPWKTAAPAGSVALDGPSPTSTILSTAGSSVISTSKGSIDPTQSSNDDSGNPQQPSLQESVPLSTPEPTGNPEPRSTNDRPSHSGTLAIPDPLSRQSSFSVSYELDERPVYDVGGEKITLGGLAVTVKGVEISLDASATGLLSGSENIFVDSPTKTIPSLTIDHQTISANSASMYIISEQTLSPNGPAITLSGTTYSLAVSATALLVGSSTISLGAPQSAPPTLHISGTTYTADTQPRLRFQATEVIAGGPSVTISNVPYALDASATMFYIGSSRIAVSSLLQQASSPSLLPDNDGVVAVPLVVGSSTTTLQVASGDQSPTIIINATPYTANTASAFIIGTQTLAPGSPAITINSTRYSLPSIPTSSSVTAAQAQAAISVGSSLYTCRQNAPCTIASQVLRPNGTITVGAETLVYGEGGIDVIKEEKTTLGAERGEVITSHISGLTPIGEETGTAQAAGTGNAREESGAMIIGADARNLYPLLGMVGAIIVGCLVFD